MLNRSVFIGRITKEPELRKTKNNEAFVSFTLAVKRDKSEATDYPDCVAYKKIAETICKYVHKGDLISVEGKTQTRIKDNKKFTELKVDNMYFISNKPTEEKIENSISIPEETE